MANRLGIDLSGKKVVMEGAGAEESRTVQVNAGTAEYFAKEQRAQEEQAAHSVL